MRLTKEVYKEFKTYPEKIIQFGEGNFLRGFVDWQIDKMNEKSEFNGSVVVIQPREGSSIDRLNSQDGLYTLYLQGIKNGETVKKHKVINTISRGINPYRDYDEYLKLAENPEIRFIVSNTTEAGIVFNENDKLDGECQRSFPGKLTALLYKRFKIFNGAIDTGFIIIPCELIDRNGDVLKEIVLRYAKLWNLEEDFINWINRGNVFCCSLVDRIVPGHPKDGINEFYDELGYEDRLIVIGEVYHLWVIEGPSIIQDELPVEKAKLNVKIVNDMTPYRIRKVRILNGSHTAMVPVSYLYGLETVSESVNHETIGRFVHDVIYNEIIPTIDLPSEELVGFANDIIERFKNPYINHYLMSISLNSISKYKTRNLPTLIDYFNITGELPKKLVFSLAALIEFYKGKRENQDIKINDEEDVLELFKNLWNNYDGTEVGIEKIVKTVLGYEENWEVDLNEIPNLTKEVTKYLNLIENKGIHEAIKNTF